MCIRDRPISGFSDNIQNESSNCLRYTLRCCRPHFRWVNNAISFRSDFASTVNLNGFTLLIHRLVLISDAQGRIQLRSYFSPRITACYKGGRHLKGSFQMKGIYRILIALVLLVAAITSYSMGIQSGVFLFVILGFILEGAFWFGLFPVKRQKRT